VHKLAL
jgi:hypothetical protein